MISEDVKRVLLARTCENSQEGIFILDENQEYVWVNEGFCMIAGYAETFIIGKPIGIEAYEDLTEGGKITARRVINALSTNGYFHDNLTLLTGYGVNVDANVTMWRLEHEDETYYVGLLKDISSSIATQQTLFHLTHYDQVTGLPNRKFFMNQLNEYIIDTYQELVIVRINIDRYRTLTNALSEQEAHKLLNQLVNRINRLDLNNLEVFSHFGGDDFALLFELPHADDVRTSLDLIMQQFELPFTLEDEQVYIHISAGVSVYPNHGNQMDKLTRCAEKAMNHAKYGGGDDVVWFDQNLGLDTLPGIQLETQLRQALTQGEFVPYYQPKYDLRTHKLSGFEALVRWNHPTRGLLSPHYFLSTIIESRLSYELFCNMTLMVAQQLLDWSLEGLHTNVCVNTDASEFRHAGFLKFIRSVLADYNFSPNTIHIEMTESSLMVNDERSVNVIRTLKDAGISISLDDFGTGYASLSYLHHYPFDFVKIDKSFIDNITVATKHANIVKAIITMSQNLNMKVIAEGIESKEQADLLRELGCEYGQGYYFGRPLTGEAATTLLVDEKRRDFMNEKREY